MYIILLSYYKDPERTAETIDSEGWHHTGDVGMWLPNGTLRIIDRRKHIFKLSQGEYIVPEKIENIYTLSQYVNQVFVYGESLKVLVKIKNILSSTSNEIPISWTRKWLGNVAFRFSCNLFSYFLAILELHCGCSCA